MMGMRETKEGSESRGLMVEGRWESRLMGVDDGEDEWKGSEGQGPGAARCTKHVECGIEEVVQNKY